MARLVSNIVLKSLTGSSCLSTSMVTCGSAIHQSIRCSTRQSGDSDAQGDSNPARITADPDTHEDFQPTNKSSGISLQDIVRRVFCSGISLQDIVRRDVEENPVFIYMKGLPDAPRCGFSALAVKVMQQYSVPIRARDILGDPKLEESVKAFTNWPTFPQIFIKGEFVGGSDIILSMHQKGELKNLLADIMHDDNQGGA